MTTAEQRADLVREINARIEKLETPAEMYAVAQELSQAARRINPERVSVDAVSDWYARGRLRDAQRHLDNACQLLASLGYEPGVES